MRVVFDTNALLSATLWRKSSANKTLIALLDANAQICVSKEILDEFDEVVRRDFSQLTDKMPEYVEFIFASTMIVVPTAKVDVVPDKDDNKIIECALEAKAGYIVTYDSDLLKLGAHGCVKIVTPEEMGRILKNMRAPQ